MSRVLADDQDAPGGPAAGTGKGCILPGPAGLTRPAEDLPARRAQFTELAMPCAELLYATAARMLGDRVLAEDLVQETFVRAWQKFGSFELGTNFRAWLFQILTYLYMNHRRNPKAREVVVDFRSGEVAVAAPEALSALAAPDLDWNLLYPELVGDEMKAALDNLREDQRLVLLLNTLGELSYQECAEALQIPIGTVMSRLFRARRQLQQDLAEFAGKKGLLTDRPDGAAKKEKDS